MRIGSYQLRNRVLLAPMAGITDQPFRRLCAYYGAGLTFSEMMSTNPQVWHTEKSKLRLAHSEDLGLNAVQIAGSDPLEMAQAAAINVEYGAQIVAISRFGGKNLARSSGSRQCAGDLKNSYRLG